MAGRARHDVKFWAGHFTKQQTSGLTLREYCRREGIEVHQFYYWRKRAMAIAAAQPLAARQSIVVSPASSNLPSDQSPELSVVIKLNDLTSIHVPGHMLEALETVLRTIQRLSDQAAPSAFRSVTVRS